MAHTTRIYRASCVLINGLWRLIRLLLLVFAVLIHARMKVRDKGLWTAILAAVGCAVMLFNWIIINFTISGLHSYA